MRIMDSRACMSPLPSSKIICGERCRAMKADICQASMTSVNAAARSDKGRASPLPLELGGVVDGGRFLVPEGIECLVALADDACLGSFHVVVLVLWSTK